MMNICTTLKPTLVNFAFTQSALMCFDFDKNIIILQPLCKSKYSMAI